MNIHLITYLTSKLFWIYTVFRYNTILYPKNEDTQKLFAYFCAYLLSCWGSMQWGTMYGDLIFELIALLIITVAYQADWQHHVWNTLMVYIMGILCDGIPIVFFQRYAVARNPVHHHMGPGTIVMGNFIFFLLEVIIERKVGVKRSYYIKNRHWLAMLSVPVISIIVCIRILLPDRRGVRSTIVLFLLFINVFIFYLHDEVQKSYIETAKQEEMKIQMSQYAKELEMMMKSQDRLNKIHHDYKHHLTTIGAMAKTGGNEEILSYLKQMENIAGTALCHHLYTENRNTTIDKVENGVVTSVKSRDLGAKTYQNGNKLEKVIVKDINKVSGFIGETFNGKFVNAEEIVGRQLQVVVPNVTLSEAQINAVNNATKHGIDKGVKLIITVGK